MSLCDVLARRRYVKWDFYSRGYASPSSSSSSIGFCHDSSHGRDYESERDEARAARAETLYFIGNARCGKFIMHDRGYFAPYVRR